MLRSFMPPWTLSGLDFFAPIGCEPVVGDDFDQPSLEPGPAERYATASEVDQILGRLTPDLRATVVLVDGYGLDYAHTSQVLDVAPGTVASRLHRARRDLRGATEDAA